MKNLLSNLKDPLVGLPMLTPFDEKDKVDYSSAVYNVEKWNKTKADIFIPRIGPMTVAMCMRNVLRLCQNYQDQANA